MSAPFIAEIRIVGFNFAPRGWAFCNGQLLPLAQNTTLFSLLGTTYGGNGLNNFALPDMRGRAPMHPGEGSNLSPSTLGNMFGTPTVTLIQTEMPVHTHTAQSASDGGVSSPENAVWGTVGPNRPGAYATGVNTQLNPLSTGVQGASQPHNNMQPYLAMNFIIALSGINPPRP